MDKVFCEWCKQEIGQSHSRVVVPGEIKDDQYHHICWDLYSLWKRMEEDKE